jgi:hypothetical protein
MTALKPYLAGPGVCACWGLQPGHGFDAAPNGIADYVSFCKGHGVLWHCLQVIPENDAIGPEMKEECRRQGVHFGGWTNVSQQVGSPDQLEALLQRIDNYKCGFFQANIEFRGSGIGDPNDPNGWHKAFSSAFRKRFPRKPACVNTNFGGFDHPGGGYDRDASAIYIKAHFECQHEDYWVNSPNLTPLNGDFNAHNQLGWPRPSSSMTGIFGSETGRTDDQGNRLWNTVLGERPRLLASGRHHIEWIWTGEYMSEEDWAHVADKF